MDADSKHPLVVLCTCPDPASAESIARRLVDGRHAACVNIIERVRSIYRWRDEVQEDDEALMVIKTTRSSFDGLSALITAAHPYELPEVIAVPIERGLDRYLAWIDDSTA